VQLAFIMDLVPLCPAFRGRKHCLDDFAPVIRVGGSAGGKIVKQVPCDNEIGFRTADTPGRFFPERLGTAGPHGTSVAADAEVPEAALRLLAGETVPDSLDTVVHCLDSCFLIGPVKHTVLDNFLSFRQIVYHDFSLLISLSGHFGKFF
jgi:hypothetical protein